MKVLGIRCSNSDFSYAILDGDMDKPKVIKTLRLSFPANFNEGERLQWFYQEINSIIKSFKPDSISIKGAEPLVVRSKSLDLRLHIEGIIFLSGNINGVRDIIKKTNATIAKDLGLKGRAKYIKTKLDTSKIDNFESFNSKLQEAILVGWSMMG